MGNYYQVTVVPEQDGLSTSNSSKQIDGHNLKNYKVPESCHHLDFESHFFSILTRNIQYLLKSVQKPAHYVAIKDVTTILLFSFGHGPICMHGLH